MTRHVPGLNSIVPSCQSKWKSAVIKIKQLLYSWMKPGYVESEDEFIISKTLLIQFVCSAAVLSAAGGNVNMILRMLRFLQGHVFVYDSLYLHYLRRHVRHFDVAHASAHEVSWLVSLWFSSDIRLWL